jgi:hypothetical protein
MVRNVIDGVDRRMIPSGQYLAVLVDEGHDFAPEWLKLSHPDGRPNYEQLAAAVRRRPEHLRQAPGQAFSFKSVGVQAQRRTTILKINYRNTRQIPQSASAMATELLRPQEKDDDGVSPSSL